MKHHPLNFRFTVLLLLCFVLNAFCFRPGPGTPSGPEDHDLRQLTTSSWESDGITRKAILGTDSSNQFLGNPGEADSISWYFKTLGDGGSHIDGYISVYLGHNNGNRAFSSTGNGEQISFSIMVRESYFKDHSFNGNDYYASKMPFMSVTVQNEYNTDTDTKYSNVKLIRRSGYDWSPTVSTHRLPSLDGVYHGYLKLEKVGQTFKFHVSDDERTWVEVASIATDIKSRVYWGFSVDAGSSNPETVFWSNAKIFGLDNGLGCSSSQIYQWKETPGCVALPTYQECGNNDWRRRVLAGKDVTDNLGSNKPEFIITATEIEMKGNLYSSYQDNQPTDQMLFTFKEVSGNNGEIIAKVVDIQGSTNTHGGGLTIRQDLKSHKGHGPLIATCMMAKYSNPQLRYRSTVNDNSISSLAGNSINGNNKWLKLNKNGNTITCSYSTDGTSWTEISTQTVAFSGTYYAGVSYHSHAGEFGAVKFQNIDMTGFSGYCNSHGDCKTDDSSNLDKCYCNAGWKGTYCQTEIIYCNGVDRDFPEVCSNNGTCTATDTCVCNAQYGGNDCQYPKCFRVVSSDTANVCSGKGSCTSPDVCSCQTGYTGNNCQYPICFGTASNEAGVCSNHGTCTAADVCTCSNGWSGSTCNTPKCNGFVEPNACSGVNGTCVSPDNCNCVTGHAGSNCEYIVCNGKNSNNPSVCSSRGSCSNPNSCDCNAGYTGSDCETPVCNGKIEPIACSGSNGTCSAGSPNPYCSCATGHIGDECELFICDGIASNETNVCNSRGKCYSPESCICDTGYIGNYCQTPICFDETDPIACSGGNGTCGAYDVCMCSNGFTGNKCEVPICFGKLSNDSNVCSSRGNCIAPDSCYCTSGYGGNNCQYPICYGIESSQTNSVCSGNGTCSSPDNCICNSGYVGSTCDIYICNGKLSNDSTVCSSNGNCIGKEQCYCNSGYAGPNCEFNICNGKTSNESTICSSHGSCNSPNSCSCVSGWSGNDCQNFTCIDRNSCSGHGSCIGPNLCSCVSEYTGSNCSYPICYGISSNSPSVCSKQGTCTSPDNCVCISDGYSGDHCNITVCTAVGDCTGNGLCTGPNNCTCFAGWNNMNCSSFDCDEVNNCTVPKGSCGGPNICNCTSQWSGPDCDSPVCFSKSSLSSDVCSGNGNCTSPDSCSCKDGWVGNDCQYPICNSIVATNSSVCNSRGNCSQPNDCSCNAGYTGNDCQYLICNGVSTEFPNVCSGHGSCNSPGICSCQPGYVGFDCEFPICFGKPSNESNSCTTKIRGTCSSPNNCSCNTGYSGNECQNNICFGIVSTDSKVCSSHGNCTEKDTCDCQPSYYGNNCQYSDLFDFVNVVCNVGCSFNKTSFKECTNIGPSCYCNKQIQSSKTLCDSSFHITSISFSALGFSGNIPTMLNFTRLENIDLSSNRLKSSLSFDSYLPSSLKSLNLSFNQISNPGVYYEVLKSHFKNFNQLIMDGNMGCGIYPETWLQNTFSISTLNHQKSYFCDQLDLNACGLIPLDLSNYVMLPHENEIVLNYTIGSVCKYYLENSKIQCISTKSDNTNSTEFLPKSKSSMNNNVICSRRDFLNEIDQYLTIAWRYNSSLTEKISSNLNIVNLPYAQILSIDRHLIYSDNTGKTQIVYLTMNQNMTRYRKSSNSIIKCGIMNDGYFVDANSISIDGNVISCILQLSTPNTGSKEIILFEHSQQYNVTLNSKTFYLINTRILRPEIHNSFIGNIYLTDETGNQLPGISGFGYTLNNTKYGIDFNCVYSDNKIQHCVKSNLINIPEDVFPISLDFNDGNVVISTIETLFYKKNKVLEIYPKAALTGIPTDVYVTFNSSTFNFTNSNVKFYCNYETGNYSATILNSTTIKCLQVQSSSSKSFTFDIHGILNNFDFIVNEESFKFYLIKMNPIYPSESITSLNGKRSFQFSFTESIAMELESSLEVKLEDGSIISPKIIDSNEFTVNVTSNIHRNFTFWFRDSKGIRSKLSSNFISLYFFNVGSISYESSSTQFGHISVIHNPVVKLNVANIPSKYQSDVVCYSNGSAVSTVISTADSYKCDVISSVPGYLPVGMRFNQVGGFKAKNLHNTFLLKGILSYNFAGTLDTLLYLSVNFNTLNLIASGSMRNDCQDIVITWKGNQIARNVTGCKTTSTVVSFKVQEVKTGVIEDYIAYVGNPVADPIKFDFPTGATKYSTQPTIKLVKPSVLTLNSNNLLVDPVAALTTNSTIKLWNDYEFIDFKGNVKFETRFDSRKFDANYSSSLFQSHIYQNIGKRINITIWAIYIPTNEAILASENEANFIFMDLVQMNYLYPFIDKFSDSISNKTSSMNLTSNSEFFTETGLHCRYSHKDTIRYSKASFVSGNSKLINCEMNVDQLSLNTEFVTFDLYMNVSSEDSNLNFILTGNNLTYVFLKEPIQINIPTTITPNYFNENFTLNFLNSIQMNEHLVSFDSYQVQVIPEFEALNQPKYLECNFESVTGKCKISFLSLSHTPAKLNYKMQVSSIHFGDVVNFTMTSNYLKDNITFLSELPYVADALSHNSSKFTAQFNISRSLHPDYSFYCEVHSERIPIVLINSKLFECSFNSRGFEEDVSVSLYINNTSIVGLGGIISTQSSIIQMVIMKFVPEFSTFPEASSLIVRKNNSISFTVPPTYRTYNHRIVSFDGDTFSCSISGAGVISCSKTNIPLKTDDIYLSRFKIEYEKDGIWNQLINVHQGLIVYENHEIISIFPLAAVIGDNLNLTFKFDDRTMKNSLTEKIDYYCEFNSNSSISDQIDLQTLKCPVTYSHHNSEIIQLKSFFKIPTLSNEKSIYFTLNSSTTQFHYLNKSEIEFSQNDQIQFFYTSTLVSYKVNITTFIPSQLTKYFVTKLNDASGFSLLNNFTNQIGSNYEFSSSTSTSFGGKKQLTLWYKENDYSFQLSSNSLELIFAGRSLITGLSPVAAVVNRTTEFEVATVFQTTLDYGNSNFTCKYGTNESRYAVTSPATISPGGYFSCNVESNIEGVFYISVWMKSKGIERKISIVDESFKYITSDFLSPSYGYKTGNEKVTVQFYDLADTNITFIDPSINSQFDCKKINTSLHCISPALSVPTFNSYALQYSQNSKNLSIPWIIYEDREISDYYPHVVSSTDKSFIMNVTLNEAIQINQGSLMLVFAPRTNIREDYDFRITSGQNISTSVSPSTSGTYPIQLFYKNINSIEFRNMFSISTQKNLTILIKSEIDFVSGTNNIGYIKEKTNFTVYLKENPNLLQDQKSKVQCKVGNVFVKTYFDTMKSNQYICEFSSNAELVDKITLWYKDEKAIRGEILVSSNELDIIFIDYINVLNISPFASISKSQSVILKTDLKLDFYGDKVTYQCVYDIEDATTATLSGDSFNCILNTKKTSTFSQFAYLRIVSVATKLSKSFTQTKNENSTFYFLNEIQTNSLFPILESHSFNGSSNLNTNVEIDLKEDLIISKGVFCQYESTDGILFSKAEYSNSTNKKRLECTISKNFINEVVEIVGIKLWMNATGNVIFNLTSDSQPFLYIKSPLKWSSSNVLNQIDIKSPNTLQYSIPSNYFNYQLKMIPDVDSPIQTNVDCDYSGSKPICSIKQVNLDTITTLPSHLNFSIAIFHKATGKSQDVPIDKITYYSNMTIEHLKPFIVSYHDGIFKPMRFISNVMNHLNSKRFKFKCNITSPSTINSNGSFILTNTDFDLLTNEFEKSISKQNHFSCSFKSFGNPNLNDYSTLYELKLMFVSENGDIELTPTPALISSVIQFKNFMNPIRGHSLGDYNIQQSFQHLKLPTNNYKSYNYTLGVYNKEKYSSLQKCSEADTQLVINCQMVSILELFTNLNSQKRVQFDFRINGIFALDIVPYFTVFPFVNVTKISPSYYIRINSQPQFTMKVTEVEYGGYNLFLKFQLDNYEGIGQCDVINPTELSCSLPSVQIPGTYSLSLSMDGAVNYQPLNRSMIFFDDTNITISSVDKSLSFTHKTEIYVIGKEFFETKEMKVSISDFAITREFNATFINSTHVKTIIDPFYNLNLQFPRKFKLKLSFNAGLNYKDSNVYLEVNKFDKLGISPSILAKDDLASGINITGLSNGIDNLKSTDKLSFRLYLNSSYFIALNCIENIWSCNLESPPKYIGIYTLKVGIISSGWNDIYLFGESIKVYDFSTNSITTIQPNSTMIQNTTLPVVVKGNFKDYKSATFKIKYETNSLFIAREMILPGSIDDNQISLIIPNTFNGEKADIEVSFNDGINFHPIMSYSTILPAYTITSVKPKTTKDEFKNLINFLSTEDLDGEIIGSNFVNNGEFKMILKNVESVFDITMIGNPTITSNLITFTSPKIDKLNVPYEIRYPFELEIGISFNKGYDYIYYPFIYENSFPQPRLTSVSPKFTYRHDFNLTIFGLNLNLAKNCSIYEDKSSIKVGLEISESQAYPITQQAGNSTTSAICIIPFSLVSSRSSIYVTTKNEQGEINTDGFTIDFYVPPNLKQLIPASGESFGFYDISIFGDGILMIPNIYCKFGSILCEKPCVNDGSKVVCQVPAHPPGLVDFTLSYNKIDYHILNGTQFSFSTCDKGYTAATYKNPCSLCPPGTYKPTDGLYECIKCEPGTYNSFSGATSCQKCPTNSTGIVVGSTTHQDCLCDSKFYVNPDFTRYSDANGKCIPCPAGAFCNFNTTEPLALPGYWNSKTNFQNFYSCIPKESCGGYSRANCTAGYQGVRCGQCFDNYYKFRGKCGACGDPEETEDMFHITKVPWVEDYEFKPMNFETDTETPEEYFGSMNDIFDNLLSWERIKRKLFLVQRKGKKTTSKIVKKFKKKTKEEKELMSYLKEIQENDVDYQKRLKKFKDEHKLDRKMSKKFEKAEFEKRKADYERKNQSSTPEVQISKKDSETGSFLDLMKKVKNPSLKDKGKSNSSFEKSKNFGSVQLIKKSSKLGSSKNLRKENSLHSFSDSPIVESPVVRIGQSDTIDIDESNTENVPMKVEQGSETQLVRDEKSEYETDEQKELQELSEFFQ
eukprot:gene8063-12524_t